MALRLDAPSSDAPVTRSSPHEARAAALAARHAASDPATLLDDIVAREFPGEVAVVSSFGADSALLLALVAEIDPALPVIFLDTGQHFPETLAYRDTLARALGLRDLRTIRPDAVALAAQDPAGTLWRHDPDRCCALRKAVPLERALRPFAAWITGRKRYQTAQRRALPIVEAAGARLKINPLATWSAERVAAEFARRGLPRHPLEAAGYRSIGCAPCTIPVAPGADARDGRWPGLDKTECGIHFGPHGVTRTGG
jgi:phosphoadenosine phosphosulfate reductase